MRKSTRIAIATTTAALAGVALYFAATGMPSGKTGYIGQRFSHVQEDAAEATLNAQTAGAQASQDAPATPSYEERRAAAESITLGQLPSVEQAELVTGMRAADEGGAYAAHEVLVGLKPGTTTDDLVALYTSAASIDPQEPKLVTCHIENGVLVDNAAADLDPTVTFSLNDAATVPQAVAELVHADCVTSAECNTFLHAMDQRSGSERLHSALGTPELVPAATNVNDASAWRQWCLAATRLPDAWDLTRSDGSDGVAVGDANVAVAVLDTGTTSTHEDLSERVIAEFDAYKDLNDDSGSDVNSAVDTEGHGTHVCGIANATADNRVGVAGGAYNANLVAIKIFPDDSGSTDLGTILNGIDRAIEWQDDYNIRVINFSVGGGVYEPYSSWGYSYRQATQRITRARQEGILFVAAAGNSDNLPQDPSTGATIFPYNDFPGDYDDCFSVINLAHSGTNYYRSSSSNYNMEGVSEFSANRTKDISAPGTSILSTYYSSNSSYVSLSGTSMASPLVAGISTLCFAEDPSLTPDDVQELIQNTAVDLGDSGWDRETGHGMIDAYAAVSHIMSNVAVAPIPNQGYTGHAIEPELTLTRHDGTPLVEDTDYTVEFANNVDTGAATATITGTGDYVGSTTATFTILSSLFTCEDTTATYDGQPHSPVVTPNSPAVTIRYSADGGATYTLTEMPARTQAGTTTVQFKATLDDQTAMGSATVTVTPAPLTATSVTVADKTFDGSTDATVNGISLQGAVGEERPVASASSAAFSDPYAGTNKSVTASGIALTNDSVNANYVLANDTATGTGTINRKLLSTAFTMQDKVYDGYDSPGVYTTEASGYIEGRRPTVTFTRPSFPSPHAGTHTVTVTASLGSNDLDRSYCFKDSLGTEVSSVSVTTTASITRRPITLTSESLEKTYDGSPLASRREEASPSTRIRITGYDQVVQMTAGSMALSWEQVYYYGVASSQTGVGSASNTFSYEFNSNVNPSDYQVTVETGTLKVTPALLTPSIASADKTYDGTTDVSASTLTLAGAVTGETPIATTSSVAFDSAAAGTNKTVTATGIALTADSVNANYKLSSTSATTTAAIARRAVTLTSASASKTYDGSALVAHNVSVGGNGWVGGEGATYSFTGSQTAVGSSANTFTYTLAANTLAANYDITTTAGTLTVNAAPTPAPTPTPTPSPTPQSQVMYRLYNPNSGEHFYTTNRSERDALTAVGWNYEGHGWNAPKTGNPVYRLYNANAGDHHYTVSKAERDMLMSVGWSYEGVGWYSGGTTPLWRQYNPNAQAGSHNYTTNGAERKALIALGWKDEGVAWYGL